MCAGRDAINRSINKFEKQKKKTQKGRKERENTQKRKRKRGKERKKKVKILDKKSKLSFFVVFEIGDE